MYKIQVLIDIGDNKKEWRDIRPTHGEPYSFKTKAEAVNVLEMCYPESPENVARVVPCAGPRRA